MCSLRVCPIFTVDRAFDAFPRARFHFHPFMIYFRILIVAPDSSPRLMYVVLYAYVSSTKVYSCSHSPCRNMKQLLCKRASSLWPSRFRSRGCAQSATNRWYRKIDLLVCVNKLYACRLCILRSGLCVGQHHRRDNPN